MQHRTKSLVRTRLFTVAQTSSLPYRGFPTRRPHDIARSADWKSAIQQVGNPVGNPRYGEKTRPIRYGPPGSPELRTAFTLVELVALCAILALGALTLIPALARSRPDSKPSQCLNNLRQLGYAWVMYAEDNQGKLAYNPDGGSVGRTASLPGWTAGWLDFTTSVDNTNTEFMVNHDRYPFSAFLGPYIRTPVPFKCPADRTTTTIGGQRFPRARSVSMNGWVGQNARGWFASGSFQLYGKVSDIKQPTPANLFVFIEEHPGSINDGVFFASPSYSGQNYTLVDYPAAFHLDGCTFSFADGHAELHQWRDPRTMPLLRPGQLLVLNVPSPGNPDVLWLINHTTSRP